MMNLHNVKQSMMTGAVSYTIFGVLIGILLILIPTEFLLNLVFLLMGILTLIFNLPSLLLGLGTISTPRGKATLILSSVSVAIGLLMIFWHNSLLLILLGVYMLLLPVINIILAQDRYGRLKNELPKLILGLVLLLLGPANTLDILFDIAGGVVIVLSVIYLISVYFLMRKHQNTPGARVFVDTDGNGTVDAVYVDTTGDGKADTSTRYNEKQ
ncbi:MAG: hypothetical protein IJX13_08685 [Clostridia bacterium]|nr:hypothetical protein [Clostridia bacterium]